MRALRKSWHALPALDIGGLFATVSGHMHELANAQSALQQVLRAAERAGVHNGIRIVRRIGALAGVETAALARDAAPAKPFA